MTLNSMKFFSNNGGAGRMRLRHYDISSDRDTAEIRGRLLRRIRARLRNAAICLFRYDAREAEESGHSTGWQYGHDD